EGQDPRALTPVAPGSSGVGRSGRRPRLAQAGVWGGEATVGLVVSAIVASVSIGVPAVFGLVGGQRAAHVLDSSMT
ncbi:MAG TPA: hypothetical protein VKD67_08755, partial [Acidimicrobiales bacterium]|nr:hypothetical protein [Acidimicrobiales bacterium]